MSCDPATTSRLLADPGRDCLSQGGKPWPRAKAGAGQAILKSDKMIAQLPA